MKIQRLLINKGVLHLLSLGEQCMVHSPIFQGQLNWRVKHLNSDMDFNEMKHCKKKIINKIKV